jgi:hypothetical protein
MERPGMTLARNTMAVPPSEMSLAEASMMTYDELFNRPRAQKAIGRTAVAVVVLVLVLVNEVDIENNILYLMRNKEQRQQQQKYGGIHISDDIYPKKQNYA